MDIHNFEALAARRGVWTHQIEIFVRGQDFDDALKHKTAANIDYVEKSAGASIDPLFTLSLEAAQRLMDSLYECGIRPSSQKTTDGELVAVRLHLEDMRTLVFRKNELS